MKDGMEKGHHGDMVMVKKQGGLRRLDSLPKKLQKEPNRLDQYNEVIQDQLAKGPVERVSSDPVGREFYIPHKPVFRVCKIYQAANHL